MNNEKNTEPEWWYRSESKKAEICEKCGPICCGGKFKKVVEFTDSGLTLYAHGRKNETKTGSTSGRSFVLCNSSGRSINNSEIPLKELSKYNSQCSTCSDILDKTHKLLTDIKSIRKNEVLGICEHCYLKGLPIQCEKCIYITNKFLRKRVEHIEYRHDQLKKWCDEIKEMLLGMIQEEVRSTYHEEASKFELKRLLRELQKPRTDHELNIRTFPESEIEDAEAAEAVEREKKMLNKVIAILESEKFSMKGNLEKALGSEFIRNMPNKILGNLGSLTKTKLDNLLGSVLTDKIIEKILHNFGRPSKVVMDQVLGTDLTRQIIDKTLDNVGTLTTEKAENMFGFQTTNRLIDSILNKFNSSPTKDNFKKIFGKYVLKEKVSEIFVGNFKEQLSRKQLEKKVGLGEAKKMINEALNNFGRLKLEKLEKIAPGDVTKDILNKLLFDTDKLTEKKWINLFDPTITTKTINTILNNFGDSLSSKRIEEQLGSSLAKEVMKKLLDILRQEKLTRAKLQNLLGFRLTKEVLNKILANIAGESSTKQKLEKLLGHETCTMLTDKIAHIFEGTNFTVEILEKILGSEEANKVIDNMLANLSGEAVPEIEGELKRTKQSSATYCICAAVIEKKISQTSFVPKTSPQTLLAQEKKIVTDDKKQDLDSESLRNKATKKISDGGKNSKMNLVDYNKGESQVPRESKLDPVEKKEGGSKETKAGLYKKGEQLTLKKRNEKVPIESETNLAKKKTKADVKVAEALQVKDEKEETKTNLAKKKTKADVKVTEALQVKDEKEENKTNLAKKKTKADVKGTEALQVKDEKDETKTNLAKKKTKADVKVTEALQVKDEKEETKTNLAKKKTKADVKGTEALQVKDEREETKTNLAKKKPKADVKVTEALQVKDEREETKTNLAKKKTKADVKGTEALQVKDKKKESEAELSKMLKQKQRLKEKEQKKPERQKHITGQEDDLRDLLKNIIDPKKEENEEDTEENRLPYEKRERKSFKRPVKKTGLEADELQDILNQIKKKSTSQGGDLTSEAIPKEKIQFRIEKNDSKLIDLKDLMGNILLLNENKYKKKVIAQHPILQAVVRSTNAINMLAVSDDEKLREELLEQLELFEVQEKHKLEKGKGKGKSWVTSKAVSDTAIGKKSEIGETGLKTSRSMSTLLRFLKTQVKDERLRSKLQKQLERDLLERTKQAGKKIQTNLPLLQQLKKIYATEIKADVMECAAAPVETQKMIKGTSVVPRRLLLPQKDRKSPLLFKSQPTCSSISSSSLTHSQHEPKGEASILEEREAKGNLKYQLSNPEFIRRGWTKLPILGSVRQMNIYKMCPANPTYDWFNRHRNEGILFYETGEKLAEIDRDGYGRWYYRNGFLALDFYEAEEKNIESRYVVYSSGEGDENENSRAITVLASFDLLGNGIIYDHTGHERLKYNQSEGILLDEKIGPQCKWKWHHLNDCAPTSCILFETHDNINIDASQTQVRRTSLKSTAKLSSTPTLYKNNSSEQMLAIERDNYLKTINNMKTSKRCEIKPKKFKINDYFSLNIIDQGNIILMFRDGQTVLKQNLGLTLKGDEIIDTEQMQVGEVVTPFDRPKSTSVENLISILKATREKAKPKVWSKERCKKYYNLVKPIHQENIR